MLASEAQWREPLKWQRVAERDGVRARVFCASLADVFEDWPGQMTDSGGRPLWRDAAGGDPYGLGDARARLWDVVRATPDLDWLLLTKRPENIATMMPAGDWPNVWLGASVESQAYAWRLDALAEAPQDVPVRFLSYEPALGPLELWDVLPSLRWVILGGESGGQARQCRVAWFRSVIVQCRDHGVPVFVKQLGKVACQTRDGNRGYRLPLTHDAGHGGDLRDWPADLRVREFPR